MTLAAGSLNYLRWRHEKLVSSLFLILFADFTSLPSQLVAFTKKKIKKIERLHSTDYDKWFREIFPFQHCMILAFFYLHRLCFTLCWMEQGVKLLNNRNLYHLDDSKSIISCSRVWWEKKKNLVESFCVWFLSARDYSRFYSLKKKASMNFSSSPRWVSIASVLCSSECDKLFRRFFTVKAKFSFCRRKRGLVTVVLVCATIAPSLWRKPACNETLTQDFLAVALMRTSTAPMSHATAL